MKQFISSIFAVMTLMFVGCTPMDNMESGASDQPGQKPTELKIVFSQYTGIVLNPEETTLLPYTITGATASTEVNATADSELWTVTVEPGKSHGKGDLSVTAPSQAQKVRIHVTASDPDGRAAECYLELSNQYFDVVYCEPTLVPSLGGEVSVQLHTNMVYTVEINQPWLTQVQSESSNAQILKFTAEENTTAEDRVAMVTFKDVEDNLLGEVELTQLQKSEVELNWVYSDASLTPSFGYSEPAIDNDGNVFVLSGKNLIKINASGAPEWNKTLAWGGGSIDLTPSVEPDGSVVYAAGGENGDIGVYAVDTKTGSEKWRSGYDAFFKNGVWNTLTFWKAGVAVGDKHLFVVGTRGHSINAFAKEDGLRSTYASTAANGSKMAYSLTCSPVLTADGVVAAKSGKGLVGANRSLMESPSEDFKTVSQEYYVPCGIYTHFKDWEFNDRGPAIAVKYNGVNYVISGGTESNQHHFHVWCQNSSKGLSTTIQSWVSGGTNMDYTFKLLGMKQTSGSGGGGLIAGSRNEIIISGEPGDTKVVSSSDPFVAGGIAAVWPTSADAISGLAYQWKHDKIIAGSCAVDNNGYVHAVDIEGTYFILQPNYGSKTVTLIKSFSLKDFIDGAESMTVKSSVKIGIDGKIYVNANVTKGGTSSGATICFTYSATTGVSASSTWPQAGSDSMNTNRQVGYIENTL